MMRALAFVSVGFLCVAACATGTQAGDSTGMDSGGDVSNTNRDSGSNKDTGTPPHDSGNNPDTGNNNCGSGCLGIASTCCNNVCVDTTSDPNNCGGCGTPCGSLSCCSSSCVNTMGNDDNNCGGCGVTCAGTCTGGTCATTCTVDLGSCSHSVCVTGAALPEDCDISADDITFCVCELFDSTCCSGSWTSSCVTYATLGCGETCTGC